MIKQVIDAAQQLGPWGIGNGKAVCLLELKVKLSVKNAPMPPTSRKSGNIYFLAKIALLLFPLLSCSVLLNCSCVYHTILDKNIYGLVGVGFSANYIL